MTDKEKALCLMNLINTQIGGSIQRLITEKGNLASIIAQSKEFEKYESEKYVGGFYPVDYRQKIENQTKRCNDVQVTLDDWQSIQKYCYEKFINEGV